MEIRTLSTEQIRKVYKNCLEHDFPPLERRSLKNLLAMRERNEYSCLGLFETDELLGYAFFICHGKDLLIDYFAIVDGHRNCGLGSEFLRLIEAYYRDTDSLIAEIDDPDAANAEEETRLRRHRKGFYERNGFRDTGARVKTFGVRYQLIECGKNVHTADEIKDLYAGHYQRILPAVIFRKVIRF